MGAYLKYGFRRRHPREIVDRTSRIYTVETVIIIGVRQE